MYGGARSGATRRRIRRRRCAGGDEAERGAEEAVADRDEGLKGELAPVRVALTQSGNGHEADANTPMSGRPTATEPTYAIPSSVLNMIGCAR